MTMESSPAEARLKQVVAKLQHVPRLLASARENVRNPPRVFVERAVLMFHGASDLLSRDLLLAFAEVPDAALRDQLKAAAQSARTAVYAYATELEQRELPTAPEPF